MRGWLAALGVALLAGSAWGAETGDVARGLEAQYQAALIRERRLADDRELRLIAQYETELRAARARYDQGEAGAQAELAVARERFAAEVANIALRESSLRAELAAYRAEAQGLAQRATPELLDAYQRFADGDRVGAWPVIEALTQAQVRATMAAAGARAAVAVRDAAQARETMRLFGEAGAADVLTLWDQAAALDPGDFETQIYRARLARTRTGLRRRSRPRRRRWRLRMTHASAQLRLTNLATF